MMWEYMVELCQAWASEAEGDVIENTQQAEGKNGEAPKKPVKVDY